MRRGSHATVAIIAIALLAGCASAPARSTAEVAVDGPDCLAADVLTDLGMVPPDGYTRTGAEAGAVPEGFEPVAVVRCGGGPLGVEVAPPMLLVPSPGSVEDLAEGEVDLEEALTQAPEPGTTTPAPVTVEVTELRGDLGPLLDQLARPSEAPQADQACMAMMEFRPVIFLVDAEGRAVRAAWPSTSCGFLLDGAVAPLEALEVAATSQETLVID